MQALALTNINFHQIVSSLAWATVDQQSRGQVLQEQPEHLTVHPSNPAILEVLCQGANEVLGSAKAAASTIREKMSH